MSHAEAFGQLGSFMVGLETKARDLRKVLESSRNEDGKWVNGKDGTGIGERCSRAIGAASPGQVTKEMIAEVAEQDRLMRQAEETMRTDRPIEEATEKYQALVEYNQLALEDLEERLSAYGYVRPARVALDTNTAVATAAPPGVSSVARLPTGAKTGGRPAANGCHKSRPHQCETRGGGGGFVAAGDGAATAGSGAAAGTEKEGDAESGEGLEAGGVTTGAEAFVGSGVAGGGEVGAEEEEEEDAIADGAVAAAAGAASGTGGVATPARAASTLPVPQEGEEGEEDEEPGSPPTPASPGLADWEITEAGLSRSSSRRQQRRRSCGVGVGRVDDGTPSESSGGAGAADTPMTGRAAASPWGGSSSNPPTPARMKFEGWTPEERDPAGVGGNRVSSTGTPSLGFRSPLNSDVTASLIETALSVGKRPDVASTPSEEGACRSGTEITRPKPTPIKRVSLQGNEASVTGGLPKGPRGDFWGNASPESSVVASSRENTAEHRPDPPRTPETPATAALCRRRLEEADGDGSRGDDDEVAGVGGSIGPLDFVSEEEYARAPKFLTIQVSRSVLNDTIGNLNAYAEPRLASPSELLLTVDEIMGIIDQGELSRTLLLSAAHLKRIEMKGPRMYRIRT
ncbi:hypothetical protein Esi_0041_0045 [Ectocarpus siliculosus]|uniref:Uncharacterized protein n=1 Tax=Ectocarpus siliculosus TaxID=2880 RepID=D8LMT0_ECTSI|nr:hypothetical protein Esi_0041_0045 [Ectocarpus siliculosus]|eukprot:CBN74731.1 hypothetical protein Esi_0041_0045 [Ectocarpus siliculosus]